jgi:hypothetical protein
MRQMMDFLFEHLDVVAAIFGVGLHLFELPLHLVQLVDERCAQRDAPAERAAQRTDHVDVVRRAFRRPACANALPGRDRQQMGLDETRQFEIVEEVLHEFFAAQFEHEVVLTIAFVAGLIAAATAATTLGTWNLVAADIVGVTWMHHFTLAAGAMPERRFGNVLAWNRDALGVLDILDTAVAHRFRDGTTDIAFDAAQEALAVCNTLVLAS